MAIVEAIPDEFLLGEPEAQRGLTAWSNCMRAEGFDYPTPGDAFNDVAERFAALPERQDYRAEPMTEELRKIVLSEEGPKGLLDPAELAEFQQEEIAIAVAERSCYEAALEPELRRLADRLADEGPSASLEAKLREAGLFAEG